LHPVGEVAEVAYRQRMQTGAAVERGGTEYAVMEVGEGATEAEPYAASDAGRRMGVSVHVKHDTARWQDAMGLVVNTSSSLVT
jgi:hypothetical protein